MGNYTILYVRTTFAKVFHAWLIILEQTFFTLNLVQKWRIINNEPPYLFCRMRSIFHFDSSQKAGRKIPICGKDETSSSFSTSTRSQNEQKIWKIRPPKWRWCRPTVSFSWAFSLFFWLKMVSLILSSMDLPLMMRDIDSKITHASFSIILLKIITPLSDGTTPFGLLAIFFSINYWISIKTRHFCFFLFHHLPLLSTCFNGQRCIETQTCSS